jgi:predicted GTPase
MTLLMSTTVIGALARLEEIAVDLGDSMIAAEAASVRARVAQQQFVVACVGQFKRGKSTLLNALLGDHVLPTGITPVTAVPTVIRFGSRAAARIRDSHGAWREIDLGDLASYVAEEGNPSNVKGVVAVEVALPAELLANGLCLVDTPGLGSVFETNTQATLAFVPQIDVALVVLGTDPPIGAEELRLIETAFRQASRVLVVLNKADRAEARERQEACEFARRVIRERLGYSVDEVFEISARDQLAGKSWRDWHELVSTLERLSVDVGTSLSLEAGRRAVTRLQAALCLQIARAEHALTAPIEVSEERLTLLRQLVAEAERQLEDLGAMLEAQERRLIAEVGEASQSFRSEITATAHERLSSRLAKEYTAFGPRLRRAAFGAAQEIARELMTGWLPRARRLAEEVFSESMRRYADSAMATWRNVKASGTTDFRELPDLEEIVASISVPSRFRFNEQITIAQPASPLRYLADATIGVLGIRRVIIAEAHRFLDWLLELNAARVESDQIERVREGRATLERSLRAMLIATRDRAEAWSSHARVVRDQGAAAVDQELARLAWLKKAVEAVSAIDRSASEIARTL